MTNSVVNDRLALAGSLDAPKDKSILNHKKGSKSCRTQLLCKRNARVNAPIKYRCQQMESSKNRKLP